MKDQNTEAFIGLYKDAYRKCFGLPLTNPLSETESKHFANKIFDETGLVIGAKSIKNYSFFILHSGETKHENPSVATLDTFARYVLDAPYTDEVKRKEKEGHYPYWFKYKSKYAIANVVGDRAADAPSNTSKFGSQKIRNRIIILILVLMMIVSFLWLFFRQKQNDYFAEDFHSVDQDTLQQHGWLLKSPDEKWWNKRNEISSHLTLFTLRGDNWADSVNAPAIRNLLIRKIPGECFTTEIHFDNFIPKQNWQQTGILLLEDSNLKSRSIRLSIAYNDFFGGYNKPGEVLIQAISSNNNDFTRPEEIAHRSIYDFDAGNENHIQENLRNSALKIEKNGNHFRFLFASGPMENAAFKEIAEKDIVMNAKYVGLFALQGFVADSGQIPVRIKYFSISSMACGK